MNRFTFMGLLILVTACDADYTSHSSDVDLDVDDGDAAPGAGGASDTGFDDGLGSEEENDYQSLRPATTPGYVFVANVERDTISRIAVPSLEVVTAPVGVRPVSVQAAPTGDKVISFNIGSDDVSIVDAETLDVLTVDVQPSLNQMALSPDGKWAVLYHDVDAEGASAPLQQGTISYNEISVVSLETGAHLEAVVGTFPHDVVFTEDSSRAVVVSDDYLAMLTLNEDDLDPVRVQLSDDVQDPPRAEEVVLAPDNRYAFVRQFAVDHLVLVDLLDASIQLLPVGANPTDMDLTPNGDEIVVVARSAKELWVYDTADPTAPAHVTPLPEDDLYGSVVMLPDASRGLLYSTQGGQARYGVWDRTDGTVQTRRLEKPVASLGLSPDGATALVFHTLENGEISPESAFYDAEALTIIGLDTFFPNPLKLTAPPLAFANAPDGRTGYFILSGAPYLGVLDYETIDHTMQPLPSSPTHLGVLPSSNVAFVNQVHSLGRLSFYDPAALENRGAPLQTLTGFELNAEIER
ncbi:MAG: hypothetical protein AAFV53_22000 [Myxococcota bacterium]